MCDIAEVGQSVVDDLSSLSHVKVGAQSKIGSVLYSPARDVRYNDILANSCNSLLSVFRLWPASSGLPLPLFLLPSRKVAEPGSPQRNAASVCCWS